MNSGGTKLLVNPHRPYLSQLQQQVGQNRMASLPVVVVLNRPNPSWCSDVMTIKRILSKRARMATKSAFQ